ncbi:methylated-DNA--[protein]-cysteine S-methyltransferase [Nitrococcus mobilis]|uniref:methylated-DNA--[protein]-cysteine S-methyltransferase n=1 Tax=Nitrococcus mobilis Nb-231 TaxID=314278 RepID=A4BNP4_9GAMM|nr:methylated-DNA--[protein]-cysteine S-methyltransferase [Nitrococcus mobilis]EAR22843.1 bifunctional regulatory protein/DNA repair protein [Nitrococcus mobilis Nb-231]
MNEKRRWPAVLARGASPIDLTPGRHRADGAGVEISYSTAETPLGLLMMAATERGLCFVQLGDNEVQMRECLRCEFPTATLSVMPAAAKGSFKQWMRALCDYLQDVRTELDLPMDVRGTAFQMKVWGCLRTIPYGELRTYKQVAAAVGRPRAVRAVANACAANRLSLTIPCHRVIRGDGGLGGYRWGIERKRALIERERVARAESV